MIDKKTFLQIINTLSDNIIANKEILNELDMAIGDADHGSNMARGFSEVKKKLESIKDLEFAIILKTIAMTLISTVGGASGPLYGTAFLKASGAVAGKETLEADDLICIYEAVITGIKQRGQSDKGHKTMLDAIIPAYEAFKSSIESGNDLNTAALKAVEAADEGVEYTKTIKAIKGRASFLGERSIGHADPGATSSYIIIKSIADVIKED
ncbi:dihydroxyacetone kinase subunit DhaL [Tepidibacter formicigenes]|jgi:dihydroxyacetone kinase-like protein|uniref:phosphoenolpyruvate--glycerone phosphotransferase n=1 Tax=Tepidibacter formicigenes DSM 15518 TaxID=1123349 RepID=A0A1M6KJN1_9FIRM|nr:dihydroxyacetone kinase subunit DhaL [Tepidibacter formicigenes]SHJ59145.1 dihydroxyacetone kinase DhaL subunit [Tepidibacter formicigenes DSM 15518]